MPHKLRQRAFLKKRSRDYSVLQELLGYNRLSTKKLIAGDVDHKYNVLEYDLEVSLTGAAGPKIFKQGLNSAAIGVFRKTYKTLANLWHHANL